MTLNELSTVPSEAMPFAAFSEHLHLGSGFESDGAENSVLEAYIRSALAAIEARSGIALLQRRFSWTLHRWSDATSQRLPVSPVKAIELMRLIAADGSETIVSSDKYHLQQNQLSATLSPSGTCLPQLPHLGSVEIVLEAGFGNDWNDIPADLRAAVFQLAAHNYEFRGGASSQSKGLPDSVLSLLEPYRSVRLFGGAA